MSEHRQLQECIANPNDLGYKVESARTLATSTDLFGICVTVSPKEGCPIRGHHFKPKTVMTEVLPGGKLHCHMVLLPYSIYCQCNSCHEAQLRGRRTVHRPSSMQVLGAENMPEPQLSVNNEQSYMAKGMTEITYPDSTNSSATVSQIRYPSVNENLHSEMKPKEADDPKTMFPNLTARLNTRANLSLDLPTYAKTPAQSDDDHSSTDEDVSCSSEDSLFDTAKDKSDN